MVPLSSKEATSLMIEKAKQLVNQLVDYRGHDKPPFLPEEYSRLVNIRKIQETNLGATSALLLKFHDGYVIKVNQDHSQVRQNFSCAHEIGHILFSDLKLEKYLHSIEYRTFNPRKTTDLRARGRETLCDAAAAELLMPELVFRKYLSTFGISIGSIELLANAFKVSLQSATRRMAEVSIKPCVAILWYPWPKSKPKGLRPALRRQSREKANWMPVHNNVGLSSTLYKAYQNDTIIKTWKLFKDGNTVKRLPVEAKGFGHGEKRFVISLSFSDS
jgi:Zn-dependent peptidase ImmA (M78 family)